MIKTTETPLAIANSTPSSSFMLSRSFASPVKETDFAREEHSDKAHLYSNTAIIGGTVSDNMDIIPTAPTVDLMTPTEAKTVLTESPKTLPITGMKEP